jgi:hypothetical protein
MFRFTIRDVLWLTVVAATLTAWAIDHWRQASEIERLSTGILIGGSS